MLRLCLKETTITMWVGFYCSSTTSPPQTYYYWVRITDPIATTTTTTTIPVSSPICVVSLAHTNRGREKLFYSWSKLSKKRHVKYLFEIQPNRNVYFSLLF